LAHIFVSSFFSSFIISIFEEEFHEFQAAYESQRNKLMKKQAYIKRDLDFIFEHNQIDIE